MIERSDPEPRKTELVGAIFELHAAMSEKGRSFGSVPPDREFVLRRTLQKIKSVVCPKRNEIKDSLSTSTASASSIIGDAILSITTGAPIAAATLAKEIIRAGIDKFCSDPNSLIEDS